MFARMWRLPFIAFVVIALPAGIALALGFQLGETKDQLGLKYDVAVNDHGTGRVTVTFTLTDEGRLRPLTSVDLLIPSNDKHTSGGYMPDLSLSLATREVDGNQVASIHLKKELAERAQIHLKTSGLDDKREPLTWYYHSISIAKYMKANGQERK